MSNCNLAENKRVVARECVMLLSVILVMALVFCPRHSCVAAEEDESSGSAEAKPVRLLVEKMVSAYDKGNVAEYIPIFSQSHLASLKIPPAQWKKNLVEDFKKRKGWSSEISDYSSKVVSADRATGSFCLQGYGCTIEKKGGKNTETWQAYWFECKFEAVNEYGEWKIESSSRKPSPELKRRVLGKEIERIEEELKGEDLEDSVRADLLWKKASVLLDIDEARLAEESAVQSLKLVDGLAGHMVLASMLEDQKKWDEALEHYRKAIALSKSRAMTKDLEGMMLKCEKQKKGEK